jgi:serine/threonine protein kinase
VTGNVPGPGDTFGPYRLERVLGEGATGVVYLAFRDGEPVALKVLRPELAGNAEYERRFLREAHVAAAVRSRHLIPILDAGNADGRCYLVATYVPGRSLRDRLAAAGPLATTEVVRVGSHVGSALDALDRAGLVHRDVKPSNVILAEDGNLLLGDYGLAKGAAFSALTRPGELLGTPGYLAPEVIEGADATSLSDLYALGCVLYECLAGRPPFASTNPFEMIVGHLDEEPADPLAGRPEIPAAIGEVVLRALAKSPADRPRTGYMLARLLAAAA